MDSDWSRSPAVSRILAHWADERPGWLWSAAGDNLLWRNPAARLFSARLKKHGLKLGQQATPIKGQVARLIRLGLPGRTSLSRMQFLAGDRPLSATCSVTPLTLPDGQTALLIVSVDPINPEIFAAAEPAADAAAKELLPEGWEYLVFSADAELRGGSPAALSRYAAALQADGLPPAGDPAEIRIDGDTLAVSRHDAATGGVLLLLAPHREERTAIEAVRAEEGLAEFEPAPGPAQLPVGLPAPDDGPREGTAGTPAAAGEQRSLSALFDRLADHEELYAELPPTDEDEGAIASDMPAAEAADEAEPEPDQTQGPAEAERTAPAEPDIVAAIIEFADETETSADAAPAVEPAEAEAAEDAAAAPVVQYRVIGRGFTPLEAQSAAEGPVEEPPAVPVAEAVEHVIAADAEIVERVSRYNFDELSRILSDRVSGDTATAAEEPRSEPTPPPRRSQGGDGALINLAAETFILNRLPLGIMVFRDQQVLFANRALVDLVGHDSIDSLRAAGLASVFPQDDISAGPVTQLLRRDGVLMPVTARLQSISWNGRPALMLSASPSEASLGQETAVRNFAELLAEASEEGFITADRAGVLTLVSLRGGVLLGRPAEDVVGQPLSALVDLRDTPSLRAFLEQPARFAGTARPSLAVSGSVEGTELLLFAEGQAGIVTGYFGFIRRQKAGPATAADELVIEPSMLGRISRGVRRPLNTIVGFADLIRSSAFGTIENQRYLEYARDIKTAGQEIAVLVDELDDFARLREGRYTARPAELDLGGLLESCIVRVRGQANAARVLVRSGISERLPRIRADRPSLGQAVLNLLASAIDQTPAGGSVILSAQVEDNGSIVINIRDSGQGKSDLGERFVIFRDGVGKEGEALAPVRSSVGLALTRALLAVNACTLSVEPTGGVGTLFSLVIPADLVAARATTA